MSPEKQRIAILIAMGWKRTWSHEREVFDWDRPDGSWAMSSATAIPYNSPDYLNDRNAIHEAEVSLLNNSNGQEWIETLCRIRGGWENNTHFDLMVRSSIEERREALLRTIGKWEEEP